MKYLLTSIFYLLKIQNFVEIHQEPMITNLFNLKKLLQ